MRSELGLTFGQMGSSTLKPREQGDFGEFSAMQWLADLGARIFLPLGHSPDIDLIAEVDGQVSRIEVKTTTHRRNERWGVGVATRGGNQSWSRIVKRFDAGRCDFLFVHVGDGRRWFIPTAALEASVSLSLGGSKYSEFEIQPGRPIPGGGDEGLLDSATPGGVPKWSNGMRCKRIGSAFTGSNPVSPMSCREDDAVQPTAYERKLGQQGRAVINQKRRLTIPQGAFFGARLVNGSKVSVRADGPGRIVIEQVELPEWARPAGLCVEEPDI